MSLWKAGETSETMTETGLEAMIYWGDFKNCSEIGNHRNSPWNVGMTFCQDRYDIFTQPQAPNVKLRPESLGVQDFR